MRSLSTMASSLPTLSLNSSMMWGCEAGDNFLKKSFILSKQFFCASNKFHRTCHPHKFLPTVRNVIVLYFFFCKGCKGNVLLLLKQIISLNNLNMIFTWNNICCKKVMNQSVINLQRMRVRGKKVHPEFFKCLYKNSNICGNSRFTKNQTSTKFDPWGTLTSSLVMYKSRTHYTINYLSLLFTWFKVNSNQGLCVNLKCFKKKKFLSFCFLWMQEV